MVSSAKIQLAFRALCDHCKHTGLVGHKPHAMQRLQRLLPNARRAVAARACERVQDLVHAKDSENTQQNKYKNEIGKRMMQAVWQGLNDIQNFGLARELTQK